MNPRNSTPGYIWVISLILAVPVTPLLIGGRAADFSGMVSMIVLFICAFVICMILTWIRRWILSRRERSKMAPEEDIDPPGQ